MRVCPPVVRGLAVLAAVLALPSSAAAQLPVVNPTVPAARDTEPIVMKGSTLPGWSAPANQTVQPPLMDLLACPPGVDPEKLQEVDPTEGGAGSVTEPFNTNTSNCPEGYDPHSHYAKPAADTGEVVPSTGVPVERLLAYRYDYGARAFVQIPFQVDEVFTRYLDNTASGFALYSGQDQHTTYAYDGPGDREGFRFTADGPAEDPCRARMPQGVKASSDPVEGLDDNDELAFMAKDVGPIAPSGWTLPDGIQAYRRIAVTDPTSGKTLGHVYLMLAKPGGPSRRFDASNGYVRYQRDANADRFVFSESSYDNYGAAKPGLHCTADGTVVRNADGTPKIAQRRPLDTAWITTDRYRFRYDGRWLMTQIRISPDGGRSYGPDLVDRWKARAFAQDPGSETPCCGYEEEDTNWGGSSILLGERVGPVRAIRETWGADSGTNVIRRETFYREEVRQHTWLRVHPIPPLDGIYAQWDFNAGQVDRFYNARKPAGVVVDGRNDEVFGNFDDPCNPNYDGNDTSAFDQGYRSFYRQLQLCHEENPYHQSVDAADPTFGDANVSLGWSVTSGANGTIVDRMSANLDSTSPGGLAQSLVAVPYYRDDSCFDDGTGLNPGPKLKLRSGDEPRTVPGTSTPRKCWAPGDGPVEDGSAAFFQGSIGTHGVHILAIADSDNARQTVPLTEITNEWRMVMLPGRRDGSVGERYGRGFEKPLTATPSSMARDSLVPGVTDPLAR